MKFHVTVTEAPSVARPAHMETTDVSAVESRDDEGPRELSCSDGDEATVSVLHLEIVRAHNSKAEMTQASYSNLVYKDKIVRHPRGDHTLGVIAEGSQVGEHTFEKPADAFMNTTSEHRPSLDLLCNHHSTDETSQEVVLEQSSFTKGDGTIGTITETFSNATVEDKSNGSSDEIDQYIPKEDGDGEMGTVTKTITEDESGGIARGESLCATEKDILTGTLADKRASEIYESNEKEPKNHTIAEGVAERASSICKGSMVVPSDLLSDTVTKERRDGDLPICDADAKCEEVSVRPDDMTDGPHQAVLDTFMPQSPAETPRRANRIPLWSPCNYAQYDRPVRPLPPITSCGLSSNSESWEVNTTISCDREISLLDTNGTGTYTDEDELSYSMGDASSVSSSGTYYTDEDELSYDMNDNRLVLSVDEDDLSYDVRDESLVSSTEERDTGLDSDDSFDEVKDSGEKSSNFAALKRIDSLSTVSFGGGGLPKLARGPTSHLTDSGRHCPKTWTNRRMHRSSTGMKDLELAVDENNKMELNHPLCTLHKDESTSGILVAIRNILSCLPGANLT